LQANLRKASEKERDQLERLSSGKNYNKVSDNIAANSLSTHLEAQVRSLNQATRNANDGISFIQTAEGGLNEVSNILVRLRELTIQSASDTVGDKEREFLSLEYQELLDEVDRIADATSHNGTNVINGAKGVLQFQVGAFNSDANVIEFDTDGTYVGTSEIGISGTDVSSKSEALDSIENIDEAIVSVSGQKAKLGAAQSRLSAAVNNLEESSINHEAARSQIEDVNVATATAKLTAAKIQKQLGLSTLQQARRISSVALKIVESY
jgi:flagellin